VEVGPQTTRPATNLGTDPSEGLHRSLEALTRKACEDVEVLPSRVENGAPAQVLVNAVGEHSLMLVVGRRTRAGLEHLLLGSTSLAVAGRASVPVVVVPDEWSPNETTSSPVVVGLSGEDDEPLLRFGFERAAALQVSLVAVHAWVIPPLLSWSPEEVDKARGDVSAALDHRLEQWCAEFPDVEVVTAVPAERPVDAVLEAARVGQLLVVGRHTRDARHVGPRLGSITRAVLHHATVPIAVVPLQHDYAEPEPHEQVTYDVWAPMF
jgi:nucleotide-binding universal stress UspA family protein